MTDHAPDDAAMHALWTAIAAQRPARASVEVTAERTAGPFGPSPRRITITITGSEPDVIADLSRAGELADLHTGAMWSTCAHPGCGVPIFRHYAWSHQGGTPPTDHDAAPSEEADQG